MARNRRFVIHGFILIFALVAAAAAPARAWFWEQAPDKTNTVRARLTATLNSSTSTVLVDLSDTTRWPHKETGEVNISAIRVDVDKIAASSGTIKIGVVNAVDIASGTVTWVWGREFGKNVSNSDVSFVANYVPTFLRLKVNPPTYPADGVLPYVLSNDVTTDSTVYQSDVTLTAASGTSVAPGVGDVLVLITNSDITNTFVVGVEIQYHTNK
jgi:hypothetical protein